MTSIGRRCKRGDALSRAILIAREAFPFFFGDVALPRVGALVPAGARSELRAPHFPFLGSRTESFQFRRSSTVGHTRSHSEHGSQATCRRWYLAFGPGRVGRRRIHGPLRIRAGALLVLNARDGRRPGPPARDTPSLSPLPCAIF